MDIARQRNIVITMEFLVREAMNMLREGFQALSEDDVNSKGDKNSMPDHGVAVERAVERRLQTYLSELYPEIDFVGEEFGGTRTGNAYFLLDPLDGTTNFAHGMPQYGISLALIENGSTIATVLAAPEEDLVVVAAQGEGCLVNGAPVRKAEADLRRLLLDAEVNFAKDSSNSLLGCFSKAVSGVRKSGSTVYGVVMMLSGKRGGCGAIVADHLEPHDIAGCQLALREAGCPVFDASGNDATPASKQLISAPPRAADTMRALLR